MDQIFGTLFQRRFSIQHFVAKMLATLDEFDRLLYSSGMFLTTEEKTKLSSIVLSFGVNFQYVHLHSDGDLVFAVSPKVHYMQHFPMQARLINPRFVQNYMEEGLMGKVQKIWEASVSGPYRNTVQKTVLMKLIVAMDVRDSM